MLMNAFVRRDRFFSVRRNARIAQEASPADGEPAPDSRYLFLHSTMTLHPTLRAEAKKYRRISSAIKETRQAIDKTLDKENVRA
jgi:hypothetical protein